MGKTKVAVIDDSAPAEEKKSKQERKKILGVNIERDQKLKKAIQEVAKSEPAKAVGEVELEKKEEETEEVGAQQAHSEPTGRASGALRPDERPEKSERKPTPQKPGKTKKFRSKKYQEAKEKVDPTKLYPLDEATDLVKEVSYSKFDGSLEIHINTSVKNVRGLVNLPYASGKKLKIMAFGKDAENSGADVVGDDATLEEVAKGKLNFDVLVTTPEWMPKLAKVAKVLGPRGLMPNPKNGTITQDLKKTVEELQLGKTEYKTETKANIIHLGIGKISQPSQELSQNIKVLLSNIGKTKIKKASLSPTMGPGIKLDLSSI